LVVLLGVLLGVKGRVYEKGMEAERAAIVLWLPVRFVDVVYAH
jgi:hypothetical protein